MENRYYSGLDYSGLELGQMHDYSALAVVERTTHPDPNNSKTTLYHFAVRHLHRWPLGTAYPAIVTDMRKLFAAPPLRSTALAVDQTGVGRAVEDLFRSAGITASLWPITITHGESGHGSTVAKKNLVGAVQVRCRIGDSRSPNGLLCPRCSLRS